MSSSSFRSLLEDDVGFADVWHSLDEGFRASLLARGLKNPMMWAGLAGKAAGDELRDRLETHLCRLKLLNPDCAPDRYTATLDDAVELAKAAREPAETWIEQIATVSDLQLNVDAAVGKRARASEAAEQDLKRLKHSKVFELPAVWRGKSYRRAQAEGDPKAQQKAEEVERTKWAAKVVKILVESNLPFGAEVSRRGLDPGSPEASRCLQGLRWTSLKKRVCEWGPARRFLLAETGKPFPAEVGPLLRFFEGKRTEGAAKSTYGSVLSSLRFLEKAGEVPRDRWLHACPALERCEGALCGQGSRVRGGWRVHRQEAGAPSHARSDHCPRGSGHTYRAALFPQRVCLVQAFQALGESSFRRHGRLGSREPGAPCPGRLRHPQADQDVGGRQEDHPAPSFRGLRLLDRARRLAAQGVGGLPEGALELQARLLLATPFSEL